MQRFIYGLPSYYYKGNMNIFTSDTQHYCVPKSLVVDHINGTVDISSTLNGNPPLYGSFAHFIKGDEKLFEHFEGLSPDESLHSSYAYIQPRIGLLIKGGLRYQLNIRVTRFNNHYKKFDNLILPLIWLEYTLDELPLKFKIMLFMVSPIANILEVILKYGSILSFVLSIYQLFKLYVIKIKFDK